MRPIDIIGDAFCLCPGTTLVDPVPLTVPDELPRRGNNGADCILESATLYPIYRDVGYGLHATVSFASRLMIDVSGQTFDLSSISLRDDDRGFYTLAGELLNQLSIRLLSHGRNIRYRS
jgi:hypothetical protein